MNNKFKVFTIVLVTIMLLLPVLGEMNGGDSSGNGMDSSKSDSGSADSSRSDNGIMHEKARDMYENGSRMREAEGMTGMEFMHSEDSNYGSYVTFSVDNTTGDVLNFGISGTSLFDSIKIPGFDFRDAITRGAETKVESKDGSIDIHIHDNPAAVIEIKTETNANLIFNLASGVSAAKQDNMVKITAGNYIAYIVSEKATSINIAGSQISINTDNGDTIFRASPVNMPHDDMEERFMGEMMKNRAGAEVSVGKSDKYSIVNYSGDVNVTVDSIETDRMRMEVESSDHSGKFILMNIDNSSLMWNEGQEISLYLDNKPIKKVLTESELYNASESSYWISMTGKKKMEAMMFIRDFSTHQIDIVVGAAQTQGQETATPAATAAATTPKTPGFEIALGVLTIAATFIARQRLLM